MKVKLPVFTKFVFSLLLINSLGMLHAQDLTPSQWPHMKGYWKFQDINNLTKATVGQNLVLIGKHQSTTGPSVGDSAIRIAIGSYYDCRHNMAPNGGGDSVNRYTLMFDFRVLSFKKWHTFFKSDSNNNNDGECFIRPITGTNPGRIGVAATGYSKDSINPNQWYRLVISVNLGSFYRYYINGKLLHEGDTQDIDGRFALTPKMIFFGDDNQEDDTIDVASVAVFDTCLSANDIARIGTIDPCVANPPKLNLGRDSTLCDYQSIIKNAGTGYKKYQWFNSTSQPSVTLTKNIGMGKKNVWCKVTDVNGCTVADTVVITYVASPSVSLGANQSFCEGLSTKLTAGTDTSQKYQWRYLPGGKVISQNSILTTDSSGSYVAIVTGKVGCINADTIQITVYTRPAKPTITGNGNICQGDYAFLSGPGGYFDYTWNKGQKQQSISINKNDTLKLRVTDHNNCTSFYSDSVIVTVFSLPPKPQLMVTGNSTICFGDSVIISAPFGYNQISWNDGSKLFSRNILFPGVFYLSVKDSNNCKSANSDTITIKVNPRPSKPAITVVGAKSFCQGDSVQLNAPSGFNYWWSSGSNAKTIHVTTSGKYSVRTENGFGCKSVPSDSVAVIVYTAPAKPAVLKADMNHLKSSITASQYRWYRHGLLMNDTTLTIPAIPGDYYHVQVADHGCWSELSDSFHFDGFGIRNLHGPNSALKVYPNPFDGVLHLKIDKGQGERYLQVLLSDMQGKNVQSMDISAIDLTAGVDIGTQNLPAGLYQLRVISGSEVFSIRLIKR